MNSETVGDRDRQIDIDYSAQAVSGCTYLEDL